MATTEEVAPRRRGRPPRTEAQRADQRARLVEAAMTAVRRQGPEASIDDMAAAAGVSKPVLYDEFGDKLGIADAVALVLAERVERSVLDRLAGDGDGSVSLDITSAITAIVEALIDLIEREPELYGYVVRSIRTSDRGFLDNALVRAIHERALLLVGLLAPGVQRPELRILTDGVFGFVLGAVESWQETRELSKERLVATLSAVIGAGLAAVAASPPPD